MVVKGYVSIIALFITLFVQCQEGQRILMTQLEDYKVNKSGATPCLTIHYYDELAEEKDIVLSRATYNNEHMEHHEAEKLIHLIEEFYADATKFSTYVKCFNQQPHEFNFDEFLAEVKRLW